MATSFASWDWAVLALYFAILFITGVVFAKRRPSGSQEFFLGGRRMPTWAVAFSILATSLSAATFVGGPQQAYTGDLRYLSSNIGGILAALVVACFFIPAFYRQSVTTVYELLEKRFGYGARVISSAMFMLGRIFASGARLYIAALAAGVILFNDVQPRQLCIAIAVLAVVGTVYTLVGGISTVIWTDVIQMFIFIGAAGAALLLLLVKIPLGPDEILSVLRSPGPDQPSKLKLFELGLHIGKPYFGFDASTPYTILTAVGGFTLFNLAAYGTDQDLAQRMLTCRSAIRGSWSIVAAILGGIPVTLLFMAVGLLLYIFYQRPDLMGLAASPEPDDSRKVFVNFIMKEMPPGLSGLMMAGLFAAALSSLNSALNAMASTFVNDFYQKIVPNGTSRHFLWIGRASVIFWGVALGGFAMICIFWHRSSGQTLIDFALSVMMFAYAGLLAVFLAALFTKRGNQTTAISAMAVGMALIVLLQPNLWSPHIPNSHTWWLSQIQIAFPWRMFIATSIAFLVCCLTRRTG